MSDGQIYEHLCCISLLTYLCMFDGTLSGILDCFAVILIYVYQFLHKLK